MTYLCRLSRISFCVASCFFALGFTPLPNAVTADMLIQNIDEIVNGNDFAFDLDLDGNNDFVISDSGDGTSMIVPINNGAGVLVGADSLPNVFGLNSRIDGESGSSSVKPAFIYGPDGAPFNELGSYGFLGLVLEGGDSQNFGFLEITRGSTIIGRAGFQTEAGAAAFTPVPEPASSLVFAGVCGWALRRRKNA